MNARGNQTTYSHDNGNRTNTDYSRARYTLRAMRYVCRVILAALMGKLMLVLSLAEASFYHLLAEVN